MDKPIEMTFGGGGIGWAQGWTFVMTCLRWISGYMRLEMWRKTGLSGDLSVFAQCYALAVVHGTIELAGTMYQMGTQIFPRDILGWYSQYNRHYLQGGSSCDAVCCCQYYSNWTDAYYRALWHQALQERVKQQKDRKLTVYEKLRNETVDYIDNCFRLLSAFVF